MKLNWKEIGITAIVALVVVAFIYPLIKPLLQKIPVIGSYVS